MVAVTLVGLFTRCLKLKLSVASVHCKVSLGLLSRLKLKSPSIIISLASRLACSSDLSIFSDQSVEAEGSRAV